MEDNELQVMTQGELDAYVISATASDIRKLGSPIWIEWHQRLQKLQQQAVLEAATAQEELTRNSIISNGKVPIMIHEAICVSIWRNNILPEILKTDENLECTFLLYAVLYHETVAIGLVEIICYDEDACESISELVVDLIDYCVEMITIVIGLVNSNYLKPSQNCDTVLGELDKQKNDLLFDVGLRCIAIISSLANHLNKIHVSASSRLYKTHDVPLLLVEILQLEPWQRRDSKENPQIFIDGRWKTTYGDDLEKMSRYETLTWLGLWRLLLNPELNNHYEINHFKKTQLCKLIYKLTDVQIDQVPVLADLKRSLGQLGVADISLAPKGNKNPVFIEVVPQIKHAILKKIRRKEAKIADNQINEYFTPDKNEIMELAKKLSSSYTSEIIEQMDDGGPKCATCGENAAKKCSRCKSEWYCGRECQVNRWGRHKELCDKFAQLIN